MARAKQKEFTKETKEIPANRCSNLECLVPTSGTAGKSFLNVGEAMHICAFQDYLQSSNYI